MTRLTRDLVLPTSGHPFRTAAPSSAGRPTVLLRYTYPPLNQLVIIYIYRCTIILCTRDRVQVSRIAWSTNWTNNIITRCIKNVIAKRYYYNNNNVYLLYGCTSFKQLYMIIRNNNVIVIHVEEQYCSKIRSQIIRAFLSI